MENEAEMTVTQSDMCKAVAFWMNANVARYAVEVSKVERNSESYGGNNFKVTFKPVEPGA